MPYNPYPYLYPFYSNLFIKLTLSITLTLFTFTPFINLTLFVDGILIVSSCTSNPQSSPTSCIKSKYALQPLPLYTFCPFNNSYPFYIYPFYSTVFIKLTLSTPLTLFYIYLFCKSHPFCRWYPQIAYSSTSNPQNSQTSCMKSKYAL